MDIAEAKAAIVGLTEAEAAAAKAAEEAAARDGRGRHFPPDEPIKQAKRDEREGLWEERDHFAGLVPDIAHAAS